MLHILATMIAWVFALAIGFGLLGLLIWLLRVIYKDSIGKPGLRAVMIFGLAFGGFVLWSGSRIVP